MNALDRAMFDAQVGQTPAVPQAAYRLTWRFPGSPVTWNCIGREVGGLEWLRQERKRSQIKYGTRRIYEVRFLHWTEDGTPYEGGVVPDDYKEL